MSYGNRELSYQKTQSKHALNVDGTIMDKFTTLAIVAQVKKGKVTSTLGLTVILTYWGISQNHRKQKC